MAALLALIPGLGAAFNKQNLKAAVHFLSVVGTFQLTHLRLFSGVFVLAGIALYFYTIIDAYRTAQSISTGESPDANEAKFKRSIVKAAPYVGVLFIVFGILAVIQMVHPIPFFFFARLLPVALILFGGYLLTRYFRRSSDEPSPQDSSMQSYALTSTPVGHRHSSGPMRLVHRDR